MCIYTYVCMYVCMCVYIYIYIYIYTYIVIHVVYAAGGWELGTTRGTPNPKVRLNTHIILY